MADDGIRRGRGRRAQALRSVCESTSMSDTASYLPRTLPNDATAHTREANFRAVPAFDPADFGAPTGREVNWKHTPMDLVQPLLRDEAGEHGVISVEVTAPDEVEQRPRVRPSGHRPSPAVRHRRGHPHYLHRPRRPRAATAPPCRWVRSVRSALRIAIGSVPALIVVRAWSRALIACANVTAGKAPSDSFRSVRSK